MSHLLEIYGVWLVGGLIAVEAAGVPVPGETSLVTAAIYAGTVHDISIWSVVSAGVIGAVAGNVIGYGIGRWAGYPLLVRYGPYIRLTETRLKIGQYLFRRYGFLLLVVARFVPVLRSAIAPLAGANCMPRGPFLLGSLLGGVLWVCAVAFGAYLFGEELERLSRPAMATVAACGLVLVAIVAVAVARHEQQLAAAAEREFPGAIRPR